MPTSQLVVVVDSNVTSAEGLFDVHVEVQTPDGIVQRQQDYALAPSGTFALPFSFGVVPANSDVARRVRVIAQVRDRAARVLVQRSALSGFVEDVALRLPLYLPDVCRGLVCPAGTTCRGDAPVCVNDEIVTASLVRLPPNVRGREFDGSTALPFLDATVIGADADAPDASTLDASTLDASTLDASTLDASTLDASTPDASTLDASTLDASTPDVTDAPAVDVFDAGARVDVGADRGGDLPPTGDVPYLSIPNDCGLRAAIVDVGTITAASPRPVGPTSLGRVTSLRPTLSWVRPSGADGVRVQFCYDRVCSRTITTFDAVGDSARPTAGLPPATRVFWRLQPLTGGSVSGPSSATWYFVTPRADLGVDTSFGAQVDLNGDALADLGLVGTQITFTGFPPSPRITVYASVLHGGSGGVCPIPRAGWMYAGSNGGTVEVSATGDVNGDGFGDLVYSNTGAAAAAGTVLLRLGSPSGLGATDAQTLRSPADELGFGIMVKIVGDVNRDGYADLAVGSSGLTGQTTVGAVSVYLGSATGLRTTSARRFTGGVGDALGLAISGGDLNGDGYADVIASRRGANAGFAYIPGGPTGPADAVFRSAPGGSPGDITSVAASVDVNGDGYCDVAFLTGSESMTSSTPTVLAVYPGGGATGPSMLPGWTRPPSAGAGYFGRIRGGETSGDLADELFVIERAGATLRPMILLGTSGMAVALTPSTAVLSTVGTRSLAPYSASPGDIDGDGVGDFVGSATFVQAYGFPGMAVYQSGAGGWMSGAVRFAPVAMGTQGSTAVSSAVID